VVFLPRRRRVLYNMRMRPKKPLLLHLSELPQQPANPLYGHYHGAVIVILLDIKDCNVLIAIGFSIL